MVDLGSLVLLMSVFGAKVAVVYVLLGLVIAVVGETILERTGMERYVEDFIKNAPILRQRAKRSPDGAGSSTPGISCWPR